MNSSQPHPVVILISGRGSNMRTLVEQSRLPGSSYSVVQVLSDRADAAGLGLARSLGIPAEAVEPVKGMDRAAYDRGLREVIEAHPSALIVLAGFMRILSPAFVGRFADRMLNIHPSLLPKYPGLHTHRRAIEAKDQRHGATVHFVTEQLDGGPPVIQARVDVVENDTEATLAARVQEVEHRIFPLTVNWFGAGRLRCAGGHAWLDGRMLSEPIEYAAGMS